MLVLTRRNNESLVFIDLTTGNKFEIKIKQKSRGRTNIIIDAPPNIKVLRKELEDNINVNT